MKRSVSFIGVLVAIMVGVVFAAFYYGAFTSVKMTVEMAGGEYFVYENVVGDYNQAPRILDQVYYKLLHDEKIDADRGVGIYYDEPKKMDVSKLRSEVGCLVENIDSATVARLAGKYKVKKLPEGIYVTVRFPFRGRLSELFGMLKVYPAFDTYFQEKGLDNNPVMMEIYEMYRGGKIIYRKEMIRTAANPFSLGAALF